MCIGEKSQKVCECPGIICRGFCFWGVLKVVCVHKHPTCQGLRITKGKISRQHSIGLWKKVGCPLLFGTGLQSQVTPGGKTVFGQCGTQAWPSMDSSVQVELEQNGVGPDRGLVQGAAPSADQGLQSDKSGGPLMRWGCLLSPQKHGMHFSGSLLEFLRENTCVHLTAAMC